MQIYFYDLDELHDNTPLNTLYILDKNLITEKSGILRCAMNNLIPKADLNGEWPKYSCDRLVEELGKYTSVYFAKKV